MNDLSPEIVIILLLSTMWLYVHIVQKQICSCSDYLKGLLQGIPPGKMSGKLVPQYSEFVDLTEKIQALGFRLDLLDSRREPSLSLIEFVRPMTTHSVSLDSREGQESQSSFEDFLSLIHQRFLCRSALVIISSNSRPLVLTISPKNMVVEQALIAHYSDYLTYETEQYFGLSRGEHNDELGRTLHTFGFYSFISQPLIIRTPTGQKRGVLWLGYGNENPPSEAEIRRSPAVADALSYYISSREYLASASTRALQAAHSEKQKSDFFTFMSHDIKSPLHNVVAVLHLLDAQRQKLEDDDLIQAALANCTRLSELVDDIISFSQYQSGSLQPCIRRHELSDLSLEVTESYKVAAKMKGLNLAFESDEKPQYGLVDRRDFKRILSNLISNAIKYTTSGKVHVSVRGTPTHIKIGVEDSGRGMTADQATKAFIPFSRFDGTQEGSGLGLPLTKILAEQNGGNIEVMSQPGRGSIFTVCLPRSECRPDSSSCIFQKIPTSSTKGFPILLVDDDQESVASLQRGLMQAGWEVSGCSSLSDALREIERRDYPIIISDLHMPQGGAYRLLEELAIKDRQCEVFILTGQSSQHIGNLAYPARILEKPLLATDLSRELLRIMSTHPRR
jgi:nitrogen-specific signal transduction histidine kinase